MQERGFAGVKRIKWRKSFEVSESENRHLQDHAEPRSVGMEG